MSLEAMKQALEALENSQRFVEASANAKMLHGWGEQLDTAEDAITSLRTAIEDAEKQEPVGQVGWAAFTEACQRVSSPEQSGELRDAIDRMTDALMERDERAVTPDYVQGHKDGCEWSAILAEASDPRTGDWLYDDPHELAKALRKGPDFEDLDTSPQQKQEQGEPVAWAVIASNTGRICQVELDFSEVEDMNNKWVVPLYTHPQPAQPKREWVGLTEQERNDIDDLCEMMIGKPAFDAIEKKLKEKNT